MVNRFLKARKMGSMPQIEIALYEYGKSTLPADQGYIRQVLPFTSDFDQVSKELFALITNGGDEFCGQVIRSAVNDLAWSKDNGDLKIVFIAGNEPFDQGFVAFRESCNGAVEKSIVVNTIYCGVCENGIREFWKEGADLGKGQYNCIATDAKVAYVPTPYDQRIVTLNDSLNGTYVPMGERGRRGKARQLEEDNNAGTYGQANGAQRAVTKASAQYDNREWDAVDAYRADREGFVARGASLDLPEEYKGLSGAELEQKIKAVSEKRRAIQEEIQRLNKQADEFRAIESAKIAGENTLDLVLDKMIVEQATARGFVFE
jgi:hypothetical protein